MASKTELRPGHAALSTSVFREACDKFQSSLSEKQRQHFRTCPDAQSMLQSIQAEIRQHPVQTSVLTKCCNKIFALSEKLSPFFKVIDLLVSSHPEFAGIAWASIRLVFVLGTNHVEFLERVCELFEAMALKLPAYEEYFDNISAAVQRRGSQSPSRLLQAMGYIYADLIQFCFDICQVFSRKRSGFLSLRGSFVHSVSSSLFSPFDVRYDALLRRWDQHQNLVELEMQLLSSKEQSDTLLKIESMLDQFITEGAFEQSRADPNQRSRDPEQIKYRLQTWIHPPTWVNPYEAAQSQREPHSTEWFLHQDQVSNWLSAAKGLPCVADPVLSIQAKPGYGKTTLCTTMIEKIQQENIVTRYSSDERKALVFFFFDKQNPGSVASGALWRAVLAQLLHAMSAHDDDVLDIFLLFRETRLSGQHVASDNEIFCILNLLVQRLTHLLLIVDGVDECIDTAVFFRRLAPLLDGQCNMMAAMFSRPTLVIPPRVMRKTAVFSLLSEFNLHDIRMYVRPRIHELVYGGFLPSFHSVEEITTQVATRANGMFLWATLFIDYLESQHISVRERHDAINNLNRLEGLDLLYTAILKSLSQSSVGNARSNIVRAFELVLHSLRPLHISELQYAMSIPMDRPIEKEDLIPQLHKNIGVLSGALMEMDQSGYVRFVHLSVIEYLTDSSSLATVQEMPRTFSINKHGGHLSLACRCLAYLKHSVKSEPLAGSSRLVPVKDEQVIRYPFLDYATEFWSFHVLECLENPDSASMQEKGTVVVELATHFLSSQRSVMVWIESCWMFNRPPQIRHGLSDVVFQKDPEFFSHLGPKLGPICKIAWHTLLQLSKDLANINTNWAHILKTEPNEIWEPSLSAFHQSPFWQRISGARITARFEAPPGERNSICLKTQLSPDGNHLGLIRLYCSDGEMIHITILFELWSIAPNVKLREVNLHITRSCMKPFLPNSMDEKFQFPTAITADFCRIGAPGCVISIPSEEAKHTIDDTTQYIDFIGNSWRNGPLKFDIEDFKLAYDIQISRNGAYLMTIHKSEGLVDINKDSSIHLRLLNIYEDVADASLQKPSYQHIASLAFKPVYTYSYSNTGIPASEADEEGDWCALLNPQYPAVAFKFVRYLITRSSNGQTKIISNPSGCLDGNSTCLWNFKDPDYRSLRYSPKCPGRLCFDHEGQYFLGIPVNRSEPNIEWNRQKHLGRPNKPDSHISPRGMNFSQNPPTNLPYRNTSNSGQTLGELTIYENDSGKRSIAQLKDAHNGSVVLATLNEDGEMKAEMIARLPESISLDYKAVLLGSDKDALEGNRHRRILLDRADQPFRGHILGVKDETSAAQLPLLLSRDQKTIPTEVFSHGNLTLEGISAVNETRKRAIWFEEDHEAKRRR